MRKTCYIKWKYKNLHFNLLNKKNKQTNKTHNNPVQEFLCKIFVRPSKNNLSNNSCVRHLCWSIKTKLLYKSKVHMIKKTCYIQWKYKKWRFNFWLNKEKVTRFTNRSTKRQHSVFFVYMINETLRYNLNITTETEKSDSKIIFFTYFVDNV
jgi:hypothetical protein